MNNELDISSLFESILGDFSSLWSCQRKGTMLEVVTPYMNLNGEAIVVYLTKRGNRYVVSDGGDVGRIADEREVDLIERKNLHYTDLMEYYEILKCCYNKMTYCYKGTTDINMISSLIYDMVHFHHTIVDSIYLESMFANNESREKYFGTVVKDILKKKIYTKDNSKHKYELFQEERLKSLQFTGFVREIGTQKVWASMAIYGRDLRGLRNSVQRAQFGFNYAKNNGFSDVRLAAIIDNIPRAVSNRADARVYISEMNLWPKFYHSDNYAIDEFRRIAYVETLFQENVA